MFAIKKWYILRWHINIIWCDHFPTYTQNIKIYHCASEICIIYVNQNRRKEFHLLLTLGSECASDCFNSAVSKVLLTFCFIQLSSLNLRLLHILRKCTLRPLYFLHPSSYSKLPSSTPTRMSSRHITYRNKSSFCIFPFCYACWLPITV